MATFTTVQQHIVTKGPWKKYALVRDTGAVLVTGWVSEFPSTGWTKTRVLPEGAKLVGDLNVAISKRDTGDYYVEKTRAAF